MPHFVYILQCENNKLYTGYAVDVQKRYKQHLSGKGARFTRSNKPQKLLWFIECPDKSKALQLEYKIKQLKRIQKELLVQKQILFNFDSMEFV
jgi:putative endonuclease